MTLQLFYIGATGMDAFQKDMINITNNVSNAQTVGYKKSRVEFENLFPMILDEVVTDDGNDDFVYFDQPQNIMGNETLEIGSGVKVASVTKDFTQGTLKVTNRDLDLAIKGNGFLQFRFEDGSLAYSRAGNIQIDNEGNLVDVNGHLLDPPIKVPENTTNMTIAEDGRVLIRINEEVSEKEIGQITLAQFINPSGLQSIGQNLYRMTEASGGPSVEIPGKNAAGKIEQRALEFSNVDIISEMMRMVITQRAFDIISKAVQSGETMLRSATDIARA
ncbi:flagellar basal-body rod protein FlgG [bacterium]|nr:flagellar basal-body rod protein FlgG [bacterium]